MKSRGLLFVISAPSGTGKSTILNQVTANDPNIKYSVSATTRKPRRNEKNGKDYLFMDLEEFLNNISNNKILEYDIYCENYYGTLKSTVEDSLNKGIDILLEITVEGAMRVKNIYPESVLIFIKPPNIQELEKRIRNRGTENDEIIQKRLTRAEHELEFAKRYDYIVQNDDLKKAILEIKKIIDDNRKKRRNLNYDE